jgi:hypothetical protein
MLILSCFPHTNRRVTAELATRRNRFVAAFADEVWFAHVNPGGQMESLARRAKTWHTIDEPRKLRMANDEWRIPA